MSLPEVLQMIVGDFKLGSLDYRKHVYRQKFVLEELVARLQIKRTREAITLNLDALLERYRVIGLVLAVDRMYFDPPQAVHQPPVFFSPFRHIVFTPIWSSGIRGPAAIGLLGETIVTYDFFGPEQTTHHAIQDFVDALILAQ